MFLGKHVQQLICLLHTDILPEEKKYIRMFEQLATTNLIVSHEKKQSLVTLRHRKPSGRVIQSVSRQNLHYVKSFLLIKFFLCYPIA